MEREKRLRSYQNSKSFIISLEVEKIEDIVTEAYTQILHILEANDTRKVMTFGVITKIKGNATYVLEGLLICSNKTYFDFTMLSSDLGYILGACVYRSTILKRRKLALPEY